MKKVKVILVIDQLHAFVDSLIDLIPTLENQHTQYKIEQLSHIDSTLAKELENRHGEFHFKKLKYSICYVRDDRPPQKNQEVSIKRY